MLRTLEKLHQRENLNNVLNSVPQKMIMMAWVLLEFHLTQVHHDLNIIRTLPIDQTGTAISHNLIKSLEVNTKPEMIKATSAT
jgi:hypothetical protein